jgi:O-antigen biosynthesis protein
VNYVLIITKNNLALTQRCVESVRAQDVELKIHVYDNESTDGTQEWLATQPDIIDQSSGVDIGVTEAWNFCLNILFSTTGDGAEGFHAQAVLVLNNDTIIPPWFMRELASYGMLYGLDPFVTGVATNDISVIAERAGVCPPSPHPDFSAFLIGRSVWEKVGPFDERFVLYCQDCDYHVRAHRAGVHLWKANVPYFHINSQTLHRSTPIDRQAIQEQANRDRAMFKSIYECLPGTPEYNELFK